MGLSPHNRKSLAPCSGLGAGLSDGGGELYLIVGVPSSLRLNDATPTLTSDQALGLAAGAAYSRPAAPPSSQNSRPLLTWKVLTVELISDQAVGLVAGAAYSRPAAPPSSQN